MTAADLAAGPSAAEPTPPARRTHPYLWSLRRELWENRSFWIAPLAIAALVLAALAIALARLPSPPVLNGHVQMHFTFQGDQRQAVGLPFDLIVMIFVVTEFIVAFFYCLGALYGERRDRSILFWKSLPASDLTTVLAKATLPLVAAPVIAYVVALAMLAITVGVAAAVAPAYHIPAALVLSAVPPSTPLDFAWAALAASLWFAPIWGWLLLVSGWARGAPILWALGVPLGASIFEAIAFRSGHAWRAVSGRVFGAFPHAFDSKLVPGSATNRFVDLHESDPAKFFQTPDLWIGLVLAAVLIGAAVWQRRWRAPL